MKRLAIAVTALTLTFSAQSHAESWFDSLKNMLGMGEQTEEAQSEAPSAMALVGMLTKNLNVSDEQAEGGLGSLLNYAKGNLSEEKFGELSSALPGVGDLLSAAPDVSESKEAGGLGGLLEKAAEYSESIKAINDVKKQFDSLGLDTDMIMQYVEQAQTYLDSDEGKQAKELLMQGLGNLTKSES